ncbi:MAG: hypothetical protein ACI8QZ_003373, partial [Chlamydiales bacterium]
CQRARSAARSRKDGEAGRSSRLGRVFMNYSG